MFGDHIEFPCHLIALIALYVLIEFFPVATNGTAYGSGMGSKYGGHTGQVFFDIEQTQPGGPFMEMSYYCRILFQVVTLPASDDFAAGISKHAGFVVIAVSLNGINAKPFPKLGVNMVFIGIVFFKIH